MSGQHGLTDDQVAAISRSLAEHPLTIRAQRDAYRAALRVIAITEYEGHEPIWHRIAREALGELSAGGDAT